MLFPGPFWTHLSTDYYIVFLLHYDMQKHSPVCVNCIIQWISKIYFSKYSIFSSPIHRSCFQMEISHVASAEDDMTYYSKTLGILLVIATGSMQHVCLPQTFPIYLGVLSHKDSSGKSACSTAWTCCKIFLVLAPLKTGSLQANFSKSQKSLQS